VLSTATLKVTLYQKTVNLDAGEDIEILEIPLKEITAKIRNEEIDHGMVLLAFFFFWMNQGQIG
jgi:hypothetical protein